MQKIANLDLQAFKKFYVLLKEKFPGFYFEYSACDDSPLIEISKTSDLDTTEYPFWCEVHDPNRALAFLEENTVDTETTLITIHLGVNLIGSISCNIPQDAFDDDVFINKLKSFLETQIINQDAEEKDDIYLQRILETQFRPLVETIKPFITNWEEVDKEMMEPAQ